MNGQRLLNLSAVDQEKFYKIHFDIYFEPQISYQVI